MPRAHAAATGVITPPRQFARRTVRFATQLGICQEGDLRLGAPARHVRAIDWRPHIPTAAPSPDGTGNRGMAAGRTTRVPWLCVPASRRVCPLSAERPMSYGNCRPNVLGRISRRNSTNGLALVRPTPCHGADPGAALRQDGASALRRLLSTGADPGKTAQGAK